MNQAVKARVLFVDDEPRVLSTMRMLFRNHYEMYFAESGRQALELLQTQPVDVIVSDQRMPGMTGIELLRAARERNPHAMRILLTGYSDLNAIIGSINEGEIFRFVNKPWMNEELVTTVARAVAAARATVAVAAKGDLPTINGGAPGILVLDGDPNVPTKIQGILGGDYRVFGATTMNEAVNKLEHEKIGVVISDTHVENSPVLSLINILKQHNPELVSVILTDRADANAAIDLINQGQVYRFITKPIQGGQTKITVSSAVRQHNRLAQHPELTQRYEVAPAPTPPPASTTANLVERVKNLRSLMKRWV